MRFKNIHIDKNISKAKGISEINLNRLGNVVALVGKNGSGKTRILDLLEENLFSHVKNQPFWYESIEHFPKSFNSQLKDLQRQSNRLSQNQIKQSGNKVPDALLVFSELKPNFLRRIRYGEIQELQEKITDQNQERTKSFESLIDKLLENSDYDEFKSIRNSSLSYLSKLPHDLSFDLAESFENKSSYEDKLSYKRFQSLKTFIKNFLNKDLEWERRNTENIRSEDGVRSHFKGIWKLDNREFNYMEFSEGEKTLFSYALLFFLLEQNPDLNIKESIILVDEPELHLHPDSEIDLINGLRKVVEKKGQLIFATHSINILSTLNYEEIFMVKNGEIKHPSNSTIGESLSELMSIENRINKLSDFLSSVSTWTFVNFMAECFDHPGVIKTAKQNDPQIDAFKKAIRQNMNKESNILLDFGAGKGRLYEQIKSEFEFMKKISYSALEPNIEYHEQLINLGVQDIYENYTKIVPDSFDFILLCNVLHEIPIAEWRETLNSIIGALKKEGFLIIIEAKILTKGEKIGSEGYIVLDLEELKELFSLDVLPSSIEILGKEDVITCAVISKEQIHSVSEEEIKKALKKLEENTLNKIIDLRKSYGESEKDSVNFGRQNAFLTQLHINSKIAQLKLNDIKQQA